MTLRELLSFFESYYGEKYSGVFLDVITSYLEGRSSGFYQAAAKVIVKRYSRIYNKVPDVAEIEKNKDEILETIEQPVLLPEYPMRERSDEDIAMWNNWVQAFFSRKPTTTTLTNREGLRGGV
jgi:hypothetical protein